MIIYVDIDNTICKTINTDYKNAVPTYEHINYVNNLYNNGHTIVYWTSRGVGSGIDQYELTKQQLSEWGCLYHELKCDKPVYDLFIDDKTKNNIKDLYLKLNRSRSLRVEKLSIFKDKKICLLGTGASLSNHKIDFNYYDLVVGINRIYKTEYLKHINVLYYNLSIKDSWEDMLKTVSQCDNIKCIIFCPWSSGPRRRNYLESLLNLYQFTKYHLYHKAIVRNIPSIRLRPLTGIAALNHMLISEAGEINIYGFDFYEKTYISNLPKFNHDIYHDLDSNKNFLHNKIEQNQNKIKWNK